MNHITNDVLNLWDKMSTEAMDDGLSIDVEIHEVTIADWNLFLSIIRKQYKHKYYNNGKEDNLPKNLDASFFQNDILRYIHIIDFNIECFFLSLSEIEFNLNPNYNSKPSEIESVLCFMTNIAQQLKKSIVFKIEGATSPFGEIQPSGRFVVK